MDCGLFNAKPLCKLMLDYCQLEETSVKMYLKKLSFHENASQNIVSEMAAIFVNGEMN